MCCRRALLDRQRSIYSLSCERVLGEPQQCVLHLRAQVCCCCRCCCCHSPCCRRHCRWLLLLLLPLMAPLPPAAAVNAAGCCMPWRVHAASCACQGEHLVGVHTQAGTYIKEFVHGDEGRTQPNVSTLLGVAEAAKCLTLDVEQIHMDWL